MSERFLIVAEQFDADSFIKAMEPVASDWSVFTENLFFGAVQYSDDKSMTPEYIDDDLDDEDSGCVWIGLTDIENQGREALGGIDDKCFQKNLDKVFGRLGTSHCTYVNFEYSSGLPRSNSIVDTLTSHLLENYKSELFVHR